MGTYLDRILAVHRRAVQGDLRPLDALAEAAGRPSAPRPFTAALTAFAELAVIAEVKRRSPRRGPWTRPWTPLAWPGSTGGGRPACRS